VAANVRLARLARRHEHGLIVGRVGELDDVPKSGLLFATREVLWPTDHTSILAEASALLRPGNLTSWIT